MMYVVPAVAVVVCVALFVIFLIVCIACCRTPMLRFFFKINSEEKKDAVTGAHLAKIENDSDTCNPLPAGGPPAPGLINPGPICEFEGTECRRRSLKSWCTKLCGYEKSYSVKEKEAVERVKRARELLRAHPNGYRDHEVKTSL